MRDVEGHGVPMGSRTGGYTASWITGMGGIRPRRLQVRPTPSPRGKGQPGSRAVGGGGVRSPGIVNMGWGGDTLFRIPKSGGRW